MSGSSKDVGNRRSLVPLVGVNELNGAGAQSPVTGTDLTESPGLNASESSFSRRLPERVSTAVDGAQDILRNYFSDRLSPKLLGGFSRWFGTALKQNKGDELDHLLAQLSIVADQMDPGADAFDRSQVKERLESAMDALGLSDSKPAKKVIGKDDPVSAETMAKALGALVNAKYGGPQVIPPCAAPFEAGPVLDKVNFSMHLSALAYQDEAAVRKELECLGFDLSTLTFINNAATDTQGFVVRDPMGNIHTSFRGTSAAADMVVNLKGARHTPDWATEDMGVHIGFDGALDAVWPDVLKAFDTAGGADPDTRMCFHGHSLGGALSQIAAVRAVSEGRLKGEQISLVTIGSPRVGEDGFAQFIDDHLPDAFRFVTRDDDDRDLVPGLPPKRMGYRHGGIEIILDSEKLIQNLPRSRSRNVALEAISRRVDRRDEPVAEVEAMSDDELTAYLENVFNVPGAGGAPQGARSLSPHGPGLESVRSFGIFNRLEQHGKAVYLDRLGQALRERIRGL